MFTISLIFIGITTFLNGFLPLIDENNTREVTVMNVLTGLMVSIFAIFGIITAVDTNYIIQCGSLLLFAFTFLYIASSYIYDLDECGIGWFSAIIMVISIALGIYYVINANTLLGVLWLIWSLNWIAYFLSRGLNILKNPSNFVILLEGGCLTVVGMLFLTGILAI